jgi:drug/metabolite transporter (DMT)-like permease
VDQSIDSIRRFAGLALVTGLCFAAAAAVLALLTGSFDDTDTRVILTSIGFAIASATASSGAAARLRPSEGLQLLGTATLIASVAAFLLLLAGLWTNIDEWGSEGVWRTFGCVAILGIAGSHACLMFGALRRADVPVVRVLTLSAICFAAFDSLAVILPLAGLVDDIDEPWPRIFGAVLVLLVLTSVLPPIMRRMQPAARPEQNTNGLLQIADKIDALNSDPGNRTPEIQAEVNRLRNLARSFEN